MKRNNEVGLPFWLSFGLSAGFFWGAWKLWDLSKAGYDIAALVAVLLCLLSGRQLLVGVSELFGSLWRRKIEREVTRKDNKHGNADWADIRILEKAGMTKPGGVLLGELEGRDLYSNGEGHQLVLGPPGSAKTTSFVIPNLLNWQGSLLCVDPTAEIYFVTERFRREVLGQEVLLICPEAETLSAEFGKELVDCGFNIFADLGKGSQVKDRLERRVSYQSPGKANMNASDDFWNDGGREFNCCGAGFELWQHGCVDPVRVRKFGMLPMDELYAAFVEMEHSDAFAGYLSELASKFLGLMKGAPQQFAGILGSAQKAVRHFDPFGSIGKSACRNGVNFADLKKRNVSVYIVPPRGTPEMQAAWMGPIVSTAIEQLCEERTNTSVLTIIDEFCGIGFQPGWASNLAQCRKFGIRAAMIVQSLSQLGRVYGQEGMKEIVSMCNCVSALSITDSATLKYFSEWLGTKTEKQFSKHVSPNQRSGAFSYNYNASDIAVPLMRPEEIRQMDSSEALMVYRDLPPIKCKKISYLKRESLRKLADPNPYYVA